MRKQFIALGLVVSLGCGAAALADATVTFDGGDAAGWTGPQGIGGGTYVDTADGNPAPSLHTVFEDFGIAFCNDTNPEFIGDYTQSPSVSFDVQVKTNSIWFFSLEVPRNLILELRDRDNAGDYPWVSVWYNLGTIESANPGWSTFSVTISDTSATELPEGWGGYGAEDEYAGPILPAGRTFANVLAGIDEIALTTLEPGYFYGFANFDVQIDNIHISRVPEPATLALFALVGLLRRR